MVTARGKARLGIDRRLRIRAQRPPKPLVRAAAVICPKAGIGIGPAIVDVLGKEAGVFLCPPGLPPLIPREDGRQIKDLCCRQSPIPAHRYQQVKAVAVREQLPASA